jgi:hypothetical protein
VLLLLPLQQLFPGATSFLPRTLQTARLKAAYRQRASRHLNVGTNETSLPFHAEN